MYGKAIQTKDAVKILKKNGFKLLRTKSDHLIFGDIFGQRVVITNGKPLSQKTWKRECKRVGIKEVD